MRQTLFHIPAELLGIPTLGLGWLLAFWAVVSLVFAWSTYREVGATQALISLAIYFALGFAVIGFLLPNVEEHVGATNLGLPVRGYGVCMFIAVSSGVGLAIFRGRRRGLDTDRITALAIWLFVAGIFGARLFYLINKRDEFVTETWGEWFRQAVNIAGGGLVVYGSLIGALIAYSLFVYRHRLPPLMVADLLAPSMLLGLAIGRIGCLMNGCCYGGPCEYSWAVQFPQQSPPYMEQLESGLQHGVHWSIAASEKAEAEMDGDANDEPRQIDPNSQFNVSYVDPKGPAAAGGLEPGMRLDLADVQELADAEPEQSVSVVDRSQAVGPPMRWKAELAPSRSLPTHPTQIYSAINASLLCLFILALGPFVKRDGFLLAITLMVYPISRYLLEIVRIDEPSLNHFGWTISQTVSVLFLPIGIALAIYIIRQPVGKQHARLVGKATGA